MPPHKPARPLGRADHKARVADTTSELDKLLSSISSDPGAGPWGVWAKKLLKGGQVEDETKAPKK